MNVVSLAEVQPRRLENRVKRLAVDLAVVEAQRDALLDAIAEMDRRMAEARNRLSIAQEALETVSKSAN